MFKNLKNLFYLRNVNIRGKWNTSAQKINCLFENRPYYVYSDNITTDRLTDEMVGSAMYITNKVNKTSFSAPEIDGYMVLNKSSLHTWSTIYANVRNKDIYAHEKVLFFNFGFCLFLEWCDGMMKPYIKIYRCTLHARSHSRKTGIFVREIFVELSWCLHKLEV